MVSLLVLPLAFPLFLLAVLLVWLNSGLPVFFKQTRIGWHGKPFELVKIRTIRNDFHNAPGAQHTASDITAIGKVLRKVRLDELPQVWSILKGEMSWVGPRPEVPYYFEHYSNLHPDYSTRQLARPGITGLAQLNNPNATPNENLEKLTFDLDYVRRASLWLDIRIIIQSFLFIWK